MIDVETTTRPKRVARDLRAGLAAAGHPLTHSRCLELASRMLGHPSYGMLARSAGRGGGSPDDHAVTPAEAAARRAFQARVLLQAGVPPGLVEAALDAARATSRSAGTPRTGLAPFGYACLDSPMGLSEGDMPAGWRCAPGRFPDRMSSLADLEPEVTWWSNVDYSSHRRLGLQGSPVLHDRYLTVTPGDVARENGLVGSGPSSHGAVAGLSSQVLDISRGLVASPLRASRTLILAFAAEWRPDPGYRPAPVPLGEQWEEFDVTAIRSHRGSEFETFRLPRLAYAREMTAVDVPCGQSRFVDLSDIPTMAGRRRWIEGRPAVAFVKVDPSAASGISCPVRKAVMHAGAPFWIARPHYDTLFEGAEPSPLAVILAHGARPVETLLPAKLRDFLDDADDASWAHGIVAESIWRSALSLGVPRPEGSWQSGLGAAYLRGVDRARTCREAVRLAGEGCAVASYGLGWVRYTRTSPGRASWPASWGEAVARS